MNTETVALQLPVSLYTDLQNLAVETNQNPVAIIAAWIEEAQQLREWQRGWAELRAQVQHDGNFSVDETAEDIVALTRRSRQEIFEAEYAHLYR